MAPRLFALVKWIGGVDDKKFTSGIPVEWIKGFNYDDFRSQNFDPTESYVIEWRSKPKEPPGGWPVYDGYVIEVSSRISQLENKLNALDGFLSPTKIILPSKATQELDPKSSKSMDGDMNELKRNSESTDGDKRTADEHDIPDVSDDENNEASQNKNIQPVKGGRRKKAEKTNESGTTINIPLEVGNITALNDMQEAHFSRNDPVNQTKTANKIRRHKSQKVGEQSSEEETVVSVVSGVAPIDGKKSRTRLYQSTPNGADKYGPTLVRIEKELKLLRKKRYRNLDPDTTDSSEDEMIQQNEDEGREEEGVGDEQ